MCPSSSEHLSAQQSQTLAQRVQQRREEVGLSQKGLADAANIPLTQVQDIESGIELFLSPSVRQKLARALKIKPSVLKNLEKPAPPPRPPLSLEARERYIDEILHFPNQPHACPVCGERLDVRIFERRDLEDNLLIEVKANCSRCLFRL